MNTNDKPKVSDLEEIVWELRGFGEILKCLGDQDDPLSDDGAYALSCTAWNLANRVEAIYRESTGVPEDPKTKAPEPGGWEAT